MSETASCGHEVCEKDGTHLSMLDVGEEVGPVYCPLCFPEVEGPANEAGLKGRCPGYGVRRA